MLTADEVLELEKVSELFEMANLLPNQTGISKGYIYISTVQGNHGPRVKYYEKLGKGQASLSISIEDDPKVLAGKLHIKPKHMKQVFDFVAKNETKLLMFWNEGLYMTDDEVTALKASLKKAD